MISVILPTYEQPENARCALEALRQQTLEVDKFEVLVVDDSATDVVQKAVTPITAIVPNGYYMRASPPRVGRFTAGRARNFGAANAMGKLLVFIDQDVMLSPDALKRYWQAFDLHGSNVVYLGLYHWMRRIEFDHKDVRRDFRGVIDAGLNRTPTPAYKPLPMDEPGILGVDFRQKDFGDIQLIVDDAALGCMSGNIGYPRQLFIKLGGFDEAIIRHGGEDADLGLTAKEFGAQFLLWGDIWGVHIWHPRDQKQNAEDVQFNIDYIDRKHGIGKYADARKWMDARDWTDAQHYHRDVGGVLMKIENDQTFWVCRDKHRLGVPTVEILRKLGFKPEQVLVVPPSALAEYEVEGVAQ